MDWRGHAYGRNRSRPNKGNLQHLPGCTEGNHEKHKTTPVSGRDENLRSSDYEEGVHWTRLFADKATTVLD